MENNPFKVLGNDFVAQEHNASETARFITRVFGWMSIALVVTAFTSMYVLSSEALMTLIFGNKIVFFGLIIAELGLVVSLSGWINKMSAATATAVFLFYSCFNGLTLSSIFLMYTAGSIASTFFVTAGTFAIMAVYGYTTKSDLTKLGNLLFMALIGLILASIVNWFLASSMLYWIITYVGVLIFTGLIAYDTQQIKNMYNSATEGTEAYTKLAILGALRLYLDFINLFIYLLRILGGRKD
ncbi:MAG: Bax inhibitor-1/YccA family protein [Saprospiraceae bacterium]|jgi:FtsH-binding integral membrane protein